MIVLVVLCVCFCLCNFLPGFGFASSQVRDENEDRARPSALSASSTCWAAERVVFVLEVGFF